MTQHMVCKFIRGENGVALYPSPAQVDSDEGRGRDWGPIHGPKSQPPMPGYWPTDAGTLPQTFVDSGWKDLDTEIQASAPNLWELAQTHPAKLPELRDWRRPFCAGYTFIEVTLNRLDEMIQDVTFTTVVYNGQTYIIPHPGQGVLQQEFLRLWNTRVTDPDPLATVYGSSLTLIAGIVDESSYGYRGVRDMGLSGANGIKHYQLVEAEGVEIQQMWNIDSIGIDGLLSTVKPWLLSNTPA